MSRLPPGMSSRGERFRNSDSVLAVLRVLAKPGSAWAPLEDISARLGWSDIRRLLRILDTATLGGWLLRHEKYGWRLSPEGRARVSEEDSDAS